MRERDRVGGTDAQRAAAREVVHRPCDEREPDVVEIPQRRRDDPWSAPSTSVSSSTDSSRYSRSCNATISLRIDSGDSDRGRQRSTRAIWAPARRRSACSTRRSFDGRMKVESPRRNVRATRDIRHSERVVAAPRDLA